MPRNAGEAIAVARQFAAELEKGAAERDRAGAHPHAELAAFRVTGLLGLSVPADLGGPGLGAVAIGEVLRVLAAADASFAQVIQPHYVCVLAVLLAGTPAQRAAFAARALAGERLGNALSERGTRHSMDFRTRLVPAPAGGFILDGEKFYCTGSISAEWVPVYAHDSQGRMVMAYLPRRAPGLTLADDWTGMGQRGTASGSARFAGVAVAEEQVVALWRLFQGPQYWSAYPRFLHAAIDLGIGEGTLHAAARYVRERARPWVEAGVERAADEPHLIMQFGLLETELAATAALVRRAGRLLDAAAGDLTTARADGASAAVAEAKAAAANFAVRAADEFFALCGTGAVRDADNFSRYWRDARTHSIHDPVRWSEHGAGHYAVHGQLPRNPGHGGTAAGAAR